MFFSKYMPYRRFLIEFFLLSLLFSGCVNPATEHPESSCAPFTVTMGERASYAFIKNGSTDYVTVQVSDLKNDSVYLNISESGNQSYVQLSRRCGELIDGKLSARSRFILFGDQWVSATAADTPTTADAPPPVDWTVRCEASDETLQTSAGAIVVRKCILTPNTNAIDISSIIRYSKTPEREADTLPFAGIIKEIVEFSDGSQATAQLIQWNNL